MANILRCDFDSKDEWPARDVTVYEDRAQIVRLLDYKTTDAGEAELKLTNLPTTVVPDSIRAEVSSGNATVLEVTSEKVTGQAGEIIETEREVEIQERLQILVKENQTITARKQMLQTYYNNMIPSTKPYLKQNELFESFSSDENLSSFSDSLTTYSTEYQKLTSRELEIHKETHILNKERELIILDKVKKSQETVVTTSEISVLLQVPEETVISSGVVGVKLTYVVTQCSWKATYDIRVNREDNMVDLSYFGQVTNGSGEEWKEVQMFLSTAKPSRAGELPSLTRANVRYYTKPVKKARQRKKRGAKASFKKQRMFLSNQALEINDYADDLDELDEEVSLAASIAFEPTMMQTQMMFDVEEEMKQEERIKEELEEIVNVPQTVAEDRGGSATFKLTRLCSIPSDNVPHRQQVGSVKLKPLFTYVISPDISTSPYLRCTATNDSQFIFVKGKMNVFFNGSFVTTTDMKLVNKNQQFKVYLGKEESVKLQINPQISKKETGKNGIMSSKSNKEIFTRKLKVDNTRDERIEVLIYEQIPLPRDKKIKVDILTPNINKDKKYELYKINYMNHLEVKRQIKKGKSWEFTFSYKVEWPNNTDIVYTEALENMEV